MGRNGAAKSTTLSAVARLLGISGGSIRYGADLHIGIASQKDVLWDELDCAQVSTSMIVSTVDQHSSTLPFGAQSKLRSITSNPKRTLIC